VVLVLPSTTYRAPDFVAAANALGVELVVATEEPMPLGRPVVVDLGDTERAAVALTELDAAGPVDAVVAVDDRSAPAAAAAAARLGLPHNPPAAVAAAQDKVAMRALLAAREVPQPRWRTLAPGESLDDDLGWPVVLKPRDRSGSVGVIRVDSADAVAATAARIRAIVEDPEAVLVAEAFVPGPEVAVEGMLTGGQLDVLAVFDKPDPLDGPYFEETIYVTPSRHGAEAPLARVTADACRAIGLREGPVHAEARLTPNGPVVLEVAARSIGGLCARSLRFGAGISLEELVLRHALGLPITGLARESAASGVMMLPIPRSGLLAAVTGVDEARAVPGVVGLELTIRPGTAIKALPEGDRYLGFLFARAATPAEVEAALRTGAAALTFEFDIT
jgi:biotin carboxylase